MVTNRTDLDEARFACVLGLLVNERINFPDQKREDFQNQDAASRMDRM